MYQYEFCGKEDSIFCRKDRKQMMVPWFQWSLLEPIDYSV